MRTLCITFALVLGVTLARAVDLELQPGTMLSLPDAKESAALLAKEDAYLKRMSAYDRAARIGRVEAPTVAEFAAHVGTQTRDYTETEISAIKTAVETIRPALIPMKLKLPAKIIMTKTTGREDVGSPYCRGPLIIMPESVLAAPPRTLAQVVAHETFHVFSSHHPELRAKLYALLNFRPCEQPALPPELDARRFTNPDAMAMNYYTVVKHEDRELAVIPTLLAKSAKFDPTQKGRIFQQVEFVLIEVSVVDGKPNVVLNDGKPVIRPTTEVPAYIKAMSRNTGYIWHPEEVLADNFVRAILPEPKLNAPELPGKLIELMQTADTPVAPQ
ncbi:MAG: hypothetical protein RL088_1500 [Verrucomicrobiota bacterium]|jgi:hypothetical protein